MESTDRMEGPTLVSIIIPCYNHGKYLSDAIESARQQTYSNIEILVVDDGSSDETQSVAESFEDVHYIYQKNQGLSSARNTGIRNSKGEFLVFLDADDLLFPYSIEYNVSQMKREPYVAFVSGAYEVRTMEGNLLSKRQEEVISDHYNNMLKSNYIGMHGTVMYRRFVFKEFMFDTSLKACEDYDMYLNITRKYPVLHHTKKLAIYRMHNSNMSDNNFKMLYMALLVLGRQKHYISTFENKKAFKQGIKEWKNFYSHRIANQSKSFSELLKIMIRHYNKLNNQILAEYIISVYLKRLLKKIFPSRFIQWSKQMNNL